MATNLMGGLGGWQFGIHPEAAGAVIRSMDRIELEVGDALRVEMGTPGSADVIHVQVYIATSSGGWAMWISCPPDDLAGHEARLAAIKPPETTDERADGPG